MLFFVFLYDLSILTVAGILFTQELGQYAYYPGSHHTDMVVGQYAYCPGSKHTDRVSKRAETYAPFDSGGTILSAVSKMATVGDLGDLERSQPGGHNFDLSEKK